MIKILFSFKSIPILIPIAIGRASGVFFLVAFFFLSSNCHSQNSSCITSTLRRIQNQQTVADPYFLPGIFPSYISKGPHYDEKQKDNNVFYNALVGYTLNTLRNDLAAKDLMIVDSIQSSNQKVFPHFKNAKGRLTYNFARTDTAFTFPFNGWTSKLRGDLAFPDDLDCTALVLMSEQVSPDVAKQAHDLMQEYVNHGKLKTTFRSYRNYPAYSAWYGKKFPVVFDVSVLCNILCLVQENDLAWTKADSASLQLIIKTLKKEHHKKYPLFVSPYYGKESLIYYHLARLMCIKPIAELEELKPELIEAVIHINRTSNNTVEKVMLSSVLLKWGDRPRFFFTYSDEELVKEVHNNDFSFFVGNIPSYRCQPFKGILTKTKAHQYYYYSNAFNDALLLEYFVLLEKASR